MLRCFDSAPRVLTKIATVAQALPTRVNVIRASVDQNTPYLYVGSTQTIGEHPQKEYLFDMSSPTSPRDLTPQVSPEGYWGWYYSGNPTGFRNVGGYGSVVTGGHMYHSGWSYLDRHAVRGNVPPTASFTVSPETVFGGDSVEFTDTSAGSIDTWAWDFDGDGSTDSAQADPLPWIAPTAGPFPRTIQARLTVTNAQGSDTTTVPIIVRDPAPVVAGVNADQTTAFPCSVVTFSGDDVQGKAPLTYDWQVFSGGSSVASGTTETYAWNVPGNATPGTYQGRLVVSNNFGQSAVRQRDVTIQALPQLTTPVATSGTPNFGDVSFTVSAQGATSWTWDFGDGTVETFTDPSAGQAPVHTYDAVGTYVVKATVDNCRDEAQTTTIQVQVTEVNALVIEQFGAQCSFCIFDTGQTIAFAMVVSGDPTSYEFDWDGNGTFEDTTTVPSGGAVTHVYNSPGSFTPSVRIRRGAATRVAQNSSGQLTIQAGTGGPGPGTTGSVTISGASSVPVNQGRTFTGNVSGCTTPSSWSWQVSGATIEGSSTGKSVILKWSTPGIKVVKVSPNNGTCSSKTGTRAVNVTSGDGGNPGNGSATGGLQPDFSFGPQNPDTGQTITFDASASSGGATSYFWDFGDGQKEGPNNEPTTTHIYANPGTYNVKLEVAKTSSECPNSICANTVIGQLTVGGEATGGGSAQCIRNGQTLCLRANRFKVTVAFETKEGQKGAGRVASAGTAESGLFYFFNSTNWEMLVKVLDGCGVNDRFWVFAASTTDVGFDLTVEDMQTGETVMYNNPIGNSAAAITDSDALAVCK